MESPELLEMEFRTPNINKTTNLYKSIGRRANLILAGRMLVLDPSCGSMSSQPGYAEYINGELIDSGVVEMPVEAQLTRRLYYLGRTLREQFPEKYDVVVVEDIPILRFSKFGRSLASQVSLHYAVGVIYSAFNCDTFLKVAPATWHSFAPDSYIKSDESDALVMGHAVLRVAEHVRDNGFKRKTRGTRGARK